MTGMRLYTTELVTGSLSILKCVINCKYSYYLKLLSLPSVQVLIDNIKEFAPIIYTPTVGLVCQNYSGLFRRPRGMYFSAKDKGEMMSMIYNWPAHQVLHESQ